MVGMTYSVAVAACQAITWVVHRHYHSIKKGWWYPPLIRMSPLPLLHVGGNLTWTHFKSAIKRVVERHSCSLTMDPVSRKNFQIGLSHVLRCSRLWLTDRFLLFLICPASIVGNFASIFYPDSVPRNLCDYLCENGETFDIVLENGSVLSFGFDDLFLSPSGGSRNGTCEILHDESFPETLIIAGLPFYNKYLVQHSYSTQQVCFAEKVEYLPIDVEGSCLSSSLPNDSSNYAPSCAATRIRTVINMGLSVLVIALI